MLNYLRQARVLRLVSGSGCLSFPATVCVRAALAPSAALGSSVPGRTCIRGAEAEVLWDANTDRQTIQSKVPLEPVHFQWNSESGSWTGNGEVFEWVGEICDLEELNAWLSSVVFLMPGLLNIELVDPTVVVGLTFDINDSTFRLQYHHSAATFGRTTSDDTQAERIGLSLDLLDSDAMAGSFRVQAAVHYFHVASRLLVVSESPWEFMPEAALNMNKVLEVLFSSDRICGNSNQQARAEMVKLGLSDANREMLISIMKLRSHMDVAHVDTWDYPPGSLEGVYQLLVHAETAMRDMLQLLLQRVREGTYELKPDWDPTPHAEALELLEWLNKQYQLPE